MTTPIQVTLPKAWSTVVTPKTKIPNATEVKTFEACGEWIQKSLWAAKVKKIVDEESLKAKDTSNVNKGPTARESKRTGGVKLSDDDYAEDWYGVLCLEESDTVTLDDIRDAFRKRCLQTHPDKQPDHSDKMFKKVQKGFDILSDLSARRAYDSSRLFDDSIPPETVSEEKYYDLFGPAFERNKKFSLDENLPSIGTVDTPIKEVKKMYDAWYRFRSWRDFSSQCDLEQIHESMDRQEKRHYQRENQRLLDKCSKDEIKRIRELVDRAEKNDPRLRKVREDEAAAIAKVKADREAEKQRAYEEESAKKRAIAEAKAKEEEDKKNKLARSKESLKELRDAMCAFFDEKGLMETIRSNMLLNTAVRQININWLSQKSSAEDMDAALQEIITKSTEEVDGLIEAVVCFNRIIGEREENLGQTRFGEAIKSTKQKAAEEEKRRLAAEADPKGAAAKEDDDGVQWTEEEVLNLIKAIGKYPGGTVDRWARMNTMLAVHSPKKFTEDLILKKTKKIESGWKNGTIDGAGLKKQVAPKLGGTTIDTDAKEDTPDAFNLEVAPVKEAFKPRLVRMLTKYCSEKVSMADAMLKKYEGKEEDFIQALVKKFGPEPAAPKHVDPNADKWAKEQQIQLEDALRELKDYKEKDKYVKIAAKVTGKDAKACFDRYKHLCAMNKKKE